MSSTATRLPAISPAAYRANVRRMMGVVARLVQSAGLDKSEVLDSCRDKIASLNGGDGSTKALDARAWAILFNWLADLQRRYSGAPTSRSASAEKRGHPASGEPCNGAPCSSSGFPPCSSVPSVVKSGRRNADALLTQAQRYAIITLQGLCGMSVEDLRAFCRDRLKFDLLGDVPPTRGRANKLINALKPIAIRKHQVAQRIDRALSGEIRGHDPRDSGTPSRPQPARGPSNGVPDSRGIVSPEIPDNPQSAIRNPQFLDPPDCEFLLDVRARLAAGRQGASVKIGSLPILLKIFSRYGVGLEDG